MSVVSCVVVKWGNLGHHDFNVAAFAEPLQVVAWIPSLDWLVRAKIGVANPGEFLAVDDAGERFHGCGVGSCLSTPLQLAKPCTFATSFFRKIKKDFGPLSMRRAIHKEKAR